MAKIVRFRSKQDNLIESVEQLLERAKNGEFINYVFASKLPDGNIATGWCNADVGERNELCSHLEVDIMMSVVEANADRIIEWI
jgi:hypothetical protein